MKKVIAFVGSAHKRNSFNAAVQFMKNLQALGDVETEIVTLSDFKLGMCRGCRVCFEKGEQFCPLRDDRDVLFEKINASDGVVFITPNYCFQMSAIMKAFIDRFGFSVHRPRFFGKAFTCIVTQGFGGGDRILKDIDFFANTVGFNTVKGMTITGFDPRTEKQERKVHRDMTALSKRYFTMLVKPADAAPSLFQVFVFRIGRDTIKQEADSASIDYRYYQERGWLESDYYYPTRLSLLKKAAGRFVDAVYGTFRKAIA